MRNYVADASVILKWILEGDQESDRQNALDLLHAWAEGRARIFAPALWRYEVGNFLGRECPSEADQRMALLLDLHIEDVSFSRTVCRRCFAWMKEKKVTFYDAVYLSSAMEIQGVLITADERFVKKMGKTDYLCLLNHFQVQ